MYDNDYNSPDSHQASDDAFEETTDGSVEEVDDYQTEETTDGAVEEATVSEKPAPAKKKSPKATRITPGERNQRRQMIAAYDFLKDTAAANEEVKDVFLGLVGDIIGEADDIADLAINLTTLSYRETKSATKGTDFAIDYLKSRREGAGLEESFALGVAFEGFQDEEKDVAKAILSRVTGADLGELKRSAGGLETLLFLARHPVDESAANILNSIRASDSLIEWK